MVNQLIEKMIGYFGTDVRRINHALKVYTFASCIAHRENLSETEMLIIEMTSVLHDIGIKQAELKYNSSAARYQETEGPPIAKLLLADMALDSEIIDRICFIIGNHHHYQKIDKVDFQILVEADFLVNIYEDKISKDAIESVLNTYFKTKTGISFLKNMYLAK